MNKTDLIHEVEKRGHLTHKQAEVIVNICFESLIKGLYEDKRIEIRGFGSFENRNYKSYEGCNPQTGEKLKVLPKKVPVFKAGKDFKEIVNS